jgi:hypothetical protein
MIGSRWFFARRTTVARDDHVRPAADHLGHQRRKAVGMPLGRIAFDDEVLTFDIAKRTQGFVKASHPERPAAFGQAIGRNAGMYEGDGRIFCCARTRSGISTAPAARVPRKSRLLIAPRHGMYVGRAIARRRETRPMARQDAPELRLFARFAAATGCRIGEAALLTSHEIPRRSQGVCPLRRRR